MSRAALKSAFALALLVPSGCLDTTGPTEPHSSPSAVITFDSVSALRGFNTVIPLRIQYPENATTPIDSISGLDFLIRYDSTLLEFISAERGPALSGWEYFTYRTGPHLSCPQCTTGGMVRVVSLRDLNNGHIPEGASLRPTGALVRLAFFVKAPHDAVGHCANLGFYSGDCSDNIVASVQQSRNVTYAGNADLSDIQVGPGFDTVNCSKRDSLLHVLQFISGSACVVEEAPGVRGDLNLNGVPTEIGDAVLLTNYFIYGDSVWDRDPSRRALQIAASDINGDGESLTLADLDMLVRVITGTTIRTDSLAPPYADTLKLILHETEDATEIYTLSQKPVSALWMWISHPGQDSIKPEWAFGQPGSPLAIHVFPDHGTSRVLLTDGIPWALFGTDFALRLIIPRSTDSRIEIIAVQASRSPGVSMAVQVGTLNKGGGP